MVERKWKVLRTVIAAAVTLAAVVILPTLAMEEEKKDASGMVVEENVIASGNVTDTVTWRITKDDLGSQTLVIGGTGPMADYTSQSEQPWQPWKKTLKTLIVEDNVTRIGNYSMYGLGFQEIQIGKGVEAIGKHSFAYGTDLEHVTIPGNVKKVEANAFVFHFNLCSVTLEEGVEILEHSSLGSQPKNGTKLHIPASLRQFDDLAVWFASEYTVAEGNPFFLALDGVLYNKELTALVDYPKMGNTVEYRIPDAVSEIKKGALQRIKGAKKIHIPSTVQIMPDNNMFQWSEIEEVYVDDGVPISGHTTFTGCSKLVRLRLPENITIERIHYTVHQGCNQLEAFKIPNGVGNVEMIGSPLKALSVLEYDAANAVIKDNVLLDTEITYELIVGENVDYLPAEFKHLSGQADSIMFREANLFSLEKGAFDSQESPLRELEGLIYVDDQGILYLCEEESGTARLVYCQSEVENAFVPAVISPDMETSYSVVSVGKNAFKDASDLTAITFEKPEQIREIEAYGFANCISLKTVNELTEVEKVKILFSEAEGRIGYRAFYNTGLLSSGDDSGIMDETGDMNCYEELVLEGEEGVSDLILSMESEGKTLEWKPEEGQTGSYHLLTGDTITILAAAGNKEVEDNHRYRIYFQKSEEDCSLSVAAGQLYTFDGQEAECSITEDPNCVYLEFAPQIGKTLSIPITAVYPSPSSDGGSLLIWAVVLDSTTAEAKKEQIVVSDTGAMKAEWNTIRNEFVLNKSSTGTTDLSLKGTEDGRIIPGTDLHWKIVLSRAGEEVSSYGKDYVRSVIYQEHMVLPEGLTWNQDVVEAVKSEGIRKSGNDYYAGSCKVCRISVSGGQLNLSGIRFQWEEETESIILSYTVTNTSRNAQMNTNTVTFIAYAEAFDADLNRFSITESQKIVNQVDATVCFWHSGRKTITATAEKTLTSTNGTVRLSKNKVTEPHYFGEDLDYKIEVYNPGALPYRAQENGSWTLREVLSPYAYLQVEDMEKMFREETGKDLTVMISGAELCKWRQKQGVFEEEIFWENGSNSGENLEILADKQLQIAWNHTGNGFCVSIEDTVYEEEKLSDALQKAGYVPGRWTHYELIWKLNEADAAFGLTAGEARRFQVYTRTKDTFQMLSEDWPGAYPTEAPLTVMSTASLISHSGSVISNASAGSQIVREAYIRKQASIDDRILKNSFTAEDGDCIQYTLEFRHYGKGFYENLPVVDEMYGAQALLVSVEKNPGLKDRGLTQYEKDGKVYYILTEGTYHNVVVGGSLDDGDYIAAEIFVEKQMEEQSVVEQEKTHSYKGLYTRIQWNWTEIPAGNYKLYTSYQALVDQQISGENVFTLGNVVWMNNKKNSRIYGSLWGGGAIIDFYKEIVEVKGQTWADDRINESGYSLVSAGDQVTYRLTLRSKGDGRYNVNGTDIADQLPINGDAFLWIRNENVTLTYESTHDSTVIDGLEGWTIEDSWNGKKETGQQYITWSDDMKITFSQNDARVYLYVTLTYPDHKEEGSIWTAYLDAVNGRMLENTFYVYQFPVNVSHHLREAGTVLLQKGIYCTSYGVENAYKETQSRNYYNNKDSQKRQVTYYMLIYNGGTKRWYLNDIYDQLPKGFVMKKLMTDGNLNRVNNMNSITTLTDFAEAPFVQSNSGMILPDEVSYQSANVQWGYTEDGTVRFHIGAGEGEHPVSYDEKRQQYYLNQKEAILFGYMCEVGITEETEDTAQNTAFMHYTDYPKTGVCIVDEEEITFSGAVNEVHADQNDGNCMLLSGNDIRNQFGVIDGDITDQWLLTDVTIGRGEIIPGITKYIESYTSPGNGSVTEYVNAVGPYDQINWRVRLHNSGTLALTDYTFEDFLPESYVLCGSLRYDLCDYLGNVMQTYEVLSIDKRIENQITFYNNNSIKTVSVNGDDVEIHISNQGKGKLSLYQNEDGKEVLRIHFADAAVSIPEGGYMDLYLSSNNPTNQYKNTVYTNQAVLTPNKQEFSSVSQGSMIKDGTGIPIAIKNSSPVTVTFGYATGSKKAVEERAEPSNQAVSTDTEQNYIVLSEKNSIFRYHLTVSNDTEKPMEKLVFIDNLPEVGDTSPFDSSVVRESEFKVRLADKPDFQVTVTEKDGSIRELDTGEYQISCSKETVFDESDWNGTSSWNGVREDARAIRILIRDDTGELVPAGAEVTVSFDCVAQESASSGQIAWNSFGYHYKLLDVNQELEAMPLKVGVKIAEVPKLKKVLKDTSGNLQQASDNMEFRFVLYEGDAVNNPEMSEAEWKEYLENDDRSYIFQSVFLAKGETQSEEIPMDSMEWTAGSNYTICELNTSDEFVQDSINGMKRSQYSFVYQGMQNQVVEFVNVGLEWSIEVLKTDKEDLNRVLEGALFALYSPKEEDLKSIGDDDSGISELPAVLEKENQTWYFTGVERSGSNGRLKFTELKEEKYYLMEVQAPDGYNREEEGWIVYRRNAEAGNCFLEITNEHGSEFPQTGGAGIGIYIGTGTALGILACGMKKRKKGEKR